MTTPTAPTATQSRTERQAAERDRLAVDRLRRIAELTAERDRLARILAVERGDESAAPEGWGRVRDDLWSRQYAARVWAHVILLDPGEPNSEWEWSIYSPTSTISSRATTALEAMEAADAARGGDDG
jgi:hypothetical protein